MADTLRLSVWADDNVPDEMSLMLNIAVPRLLFLNFPL